jgi:hypothetical protein
MEQQARHEKVLSVLVYLGLFVFLIYPYGDKDWGWHYRYGEYLFTHGRILRHDLFSWTMPGFEWVNHSWLYDPLLYVLFNSFSFWGLSLAAGALGLLVFHIGIRRVPLSFWHVGILAVCFAPLMREALLQGLRTQVIGALLFAILVSLLLQGRDGKRWCYWALPGLFLIWANLHGSFPLGLAIFAVFVLSDLVLSRFKTGMLPSRRFRLAGSFLLSVAATFLNPFTYRVYLEARRHFGNPMLRSVLEWNAPDLSWVLGLVFGAYSILLAWGFYKRRQLSDLPFIAVALLTFGLALTAKRHVPVYMVSTLPVAALIVKDLPFRAEGIKRTGVVLAILVAIYGVALYGKLPELRLVLENSFSAYCSWTNCSEELTTYLLHHPPKGRGFNFYDWGGYFIGRGVKTRLFIDGRMHLWERDGYQPMADYVAMLYRNDLERFDRYQFDWVVVPTYSRLARRLDGAASPSSSPGAVAWERVYADNVAAYLVRKRLQGPPAVAIETKPDTVIGDIADRSVGDPSPP